MRRRFGVDDLLLAARHSGAILRAPNNPMITQVDKTNG
jgi:hypothetical protein